ncbi:MAG: FG-GAP-like repeat-containing protein [Anaerolineae bacterium]
MNMAEEYSRRLRLLILLTLLLLVSLILVGQASAANARHLLKSSISGSGTFNGASSVFTADIDGDGDQDVLGAAWEAHEIAWWENTARDGSAWNKHVVVTGFEAPYSVYAADLDGDGDQDVLGSALNSEEIAWWENTVGDGSLWVIHVVDAAFLGATSAIAADIDGDTDLDIIGSALTANDVAWWENSAGDGSVWTKQIIDGIFLGAYSVHAADIDGDNDLDVIGAAFLGNDIAWWENSAAAGDGSTWVKHVVDLSFSGARSVHGADIDGDGDVDIAGAARFGSQITWWENTNGNGSAWTKQVVKSGFIGAMSVHTADVDGDGDMDLLGAALNLNDLTWWENSIGDGTEWIEHLVDGSFIGAQSVYTADLDGDNDLDILGAAFFGDEVAWWKTILLTVNTTNDTADANPGDGTCADSSGNCSLRAAIQEANALPGDDTIALPANTYLLTLAGAHEDNNASGDLDISDNLTINGAGAVTTIVNGGGLDRVFHVLNGVSVTINNIAISNGAAPSGNDGGGIYNGGSLTLNGAAVNNNTAANGGGVSNLGILSLSQTTISGNTATVDGGGIHNGNSATLSLVQSTLSGNSAGRNGGGFYNGISSVVTLNNSTISGNSADQDGGGIFTDNFSGVMSLSFSTIAFNTADANANGSGNGGGIASGPLPPGEVKVNNSIIAANLDSGGQSPDCSLSLTSLDYNLLQDSAGCSLSGGTHDIIGQTAGLAALASNGGPTLTHALPGTSPAIEQIPNGINGCTGGASMDQRGAVRAGGSTVTGGSFCDIGAYEHESTMGPTAVTLAGSFRGNAGPNVLGLLWLASFAAGITGLVVIKQTRLVQKKR